MAGESVNLSDLTEGNIIKVTAGVDDEAYGYSFTVLESGDTPRCMLEQTSPDGSVVGPAEVILEGTGSWTTPEQNPVQRGSIVSARQDYALSIGRGMLNTGCSLVILTPEPTNRQRFELMPECTTIEIER
ncbi:MAG: hypothetical protein JWO35_131 [Candidatus Saccharibacteria bacterium]|nr:hypothetical protein [Candidatus Saccharibacteria bacterium]